jgi:hypothetical protein
MKPSVEVRYEGFAPSDALDSAIRAKVRHLDRRHSEAQGWRVFVQQSRAEGPQHPGFTVRMHVESAGRHLNATRAGDDARLVLNEGFHALRGLLEAHAVRRRAALAMHGTARFG